MEFRLNYTISNSTPYFMVIVILFLPFKPLIIHRVLHCSVLLYFYSNLWYCPQISMQTNNSSIALSLSTRDLFSVGLLVTFVSSGLRGYIIDFDDDDDDDAEDEDVTCTVRYELDNRVENFVSLRDIAVTNVGHTQSRSGMNRYATLPPSAAHAGNSSSSTASVSGAPAAAPATAPLVIDNEALAVYDNMKEALVQSATFSSKVSIVTLYCNDDDSNVLQHPLIEFLRINGDGKEKGWLRKIIKNVEESNNNNHANTNTTANNDNEMKAGSDLTEMQKSVLNLMSSLLSGYSSHEGPTKGHSTLICNAFAIHRNSRMKLYERFIQNDFKNKRVCRKDKGESVFTSEKKESRYTQRTIPLRSNDVVSFVKQTIAYPMTYYAMNGRISQPIKRLHMDVWLIRIVLGHNHCGMS